MHLVCKLSLIITQINTPPPKNEMVIAFILHMSGPRMTVPFSHPGLSHSDILCTAQNHDWKWRLLVTINLLTQQYIFKCVYLYRQSFTKHIWFSFKNSMKFLFYFFFIPTDTIYTERYMGMPTATDNLQGYKVSSFLIYMIFVVDMDLFSHFLSYFMQCSFL